MKKNNKRKKCDPLLSLMIVCVALSLIMLAIVAYDKLIKEQCKPCVCESWQETWGD